jgi:Tfp pilus assembly protein PilF
VAALQAQRRDKVEKSIGLKQNEAEMQLARDAWTFGDRTACLSALGGILEREPGNVDALLLKAEVHLAKDELIEADRSIAIALNHDPSNATARRLSEIASTKQLAGRPEGRRPAMANESAPMPGGAVSQAAYSPAEPGAALVEDKWTWLPEVAGSQFHVPVGLRPDVPLRTAEEAMATAASDTMPRVVEAAGFAEALDQPHDQLVAMEAVQPSQPEELSPPGETEDSVDFSELSASALRAESDDGRPIPLRPEETTACEPSDAPAGIAEVTDQAGWEDPVESENEFQSAVVSPNSIVVLAAVEQELTNNPNDPQIPISAAVAALESNQPETAASIARLGIAFHPSCARLHRTLGAALYRTGDYSCSQVALQQALSLDNSAALSYFLMGCVSEKLGDTEAAQSNFARAAELDPSLADGE